MDAIDDSRHVLPVVQVGGDGVENLQRKVMESILETKQRFWGRREGAGLRNR